MILEAKDVTFRYLSGGKRILSRAGVRVESGERVGLTAPSGAGKTTLCKILAGYEQPEEGAVLLDGRPLASRRKKCPVQMIWQHPEEAVNPRLRMRDILADGGKIDARIIVELGIERDWLGRWPGELSGGEVQRFCIARALGEGTRFLLADESTAMLDLVTQSQIWTFLIRETQARGIGMLIVSHSDALLDRVCTRRQALGGSH